MIDDLKILYNKVFSTLTMKRTFFLLGLMVIAALISQKIKEPKINRELETPKQSRLQTEFGYASYYADFFEGRNTASGEQFHQEKLSAAHLSLPFGTKIKVTNTENQHSVIVVVNDRGPFVANRIIDLSKAAFNQISDLKQGVIFVKVEMLKEDIFPQHFHKSMKNKCQLELRSSD